MRSSAVQPGLGILRVWMDSEAERVYLNPVDEAAYLTVDPARFRLDEARAVAERFGARTVVDEAPEPP